MIKHIFSFINLLVYLSFVVGKIEVFSFQIDLHY